MNLFLAIAGDLDVGSTLSAVIFGFLIIAIILIVSVSSAAKSLDRLAQAQEKSVKSKQDTVYLLRELVTILKSKEEKKS